MKNTVRRVLIPAVVVAMSSPVWAAPSFGRPNDDFLTWIQLLMDLVHQAMP